MKAKILKGIKNGLAPIHLIEIKKKKRFNQLYITKEKKSVIFQTNFFQLDPFNRDSL